MTGRLEELALKDLDRPARSPPLRSHFNISSPRPHSSPRGQKNSQTLPVKYVEDEIRRQFFRDHPFEAFREASLVEGATVQSEHPVRGVEWRRLRQRGRNPSPEECVSPSLPTHAEH